MVVMCLPQLNVVTYIVSDESLSTFNLNDCLFGHQLIFTDVMRSPGICDEMCFSLFRYFPVEATQEMLEEWRPLLCPFDVKMMQGIFFLENFLPTVLYPEEHSQGFR